MNTKTESPIDPQGQALVECLHRLGEDPAEAYNTVQAVRSMSGDSIIHEIRNLGTSVDSNIAVQNSKIDAQNSKIESLRWMIGVVIALLTLLAILGFLAFTGRAAPVSNPCAQVESAQAPVQQERTAAPMVPAGGPGNDRSDARAGRSPASPEARQGLGGQPTGDPLGSGPTGEAPRPLP